MVVHDTLGKGKAEQEKDVRKDMVQGVKFKLRGQLI